jgi:hypothetical protein
MEYEKIASGDKVSFAALKEGMVRMGLDPDTVDDKTEAVQAVYEKFALDETLMEYQCPSCDCDLPEVEVCPFCGADFTKKAADDGKGKGKGKKGKKGGKKGRKKAEGDVGAKLFNALLKYTDIPDDMVHYKKSRTSLWCADGLIAKCFVGATSLRLNVPFVKGDYEDPKDLVTDFEIPIKNMPAKVVLKEEDQIADVAKILAQTVTLKKAQQEGKEKEKAAKAEAKKAEKAAKAEAKKAEKTKKGNSKKKGKKKDDE